MQMIQGGTLGVQVGLDVGCLEKLWRRTTQLEGLVLIRW